MDRQLVEILEPIAPLAVAEGHLAPRPASLAGLSLAILSTEGPNGRELLEQLAAMLVARQKVRVVRHRSRHGGGDFDLVDDVRTDVVPEPLSSLAKKVDVAISGVGL
jgi:hypothetical protein